MFSNSSPLTITLGRHCGRQTPKMALGTPMPTFVQWPTPLWAVGRTCDWLLSNRTQQKWCGYMHVITWLCYIIVPYLKKPLSPWLVLRKRVPHLEPRWQGTECGLQSTEQENETLSPAIPMPWVSLEVAPPHLSLRWDAVSHCGFNLAENLVELCPDTWPTETARS